MNKIEIWSLHDVDNIDKNISPASHKKMRRQDRIFHVRKKGRVIFSDTTDTKITFKQI